MAFAQENRATEDPGAVSDRGVTLRAVGIGIGMVVLLDVWVIYNEYIVRSSRLNVSHHFPVSVLGLYVLLIVGANFWHRVGAKGLTRSELLTILSMGLAGIVIPSNGITSYLLGALSAPICAKPPVLGRVWDRLWDFCLEYDLLFRTPGAAYSNSGELVFDSSRVSLYVSHPD